MVADLQTQAPAAARGLVQDVIVTAKPRPPFSRRRAAGRPVAGCEQGGGGGRSSCAAACWGQTSSDSVHRCCFSSRPCGLRLDHRPQRPPVRASGAEHLCVGTGGSGAGWWPWGSRRTRPALGSTGNFLYENSRASSTGPVPTPGTGGVPPCANRFLASSCIENQSNQKSVIIARLALLETRCVTK